MTASTKATPTPEDIAEQARAAEIEAARHRAKLAQISDAESTARRDTELQHYREAHGARSMEYRDRLTALKNRIDEMAAADKLSLPDLFDTFIELKDEDARAGAMCSHASRLEYLQPTPLTHIGVHKPGPPMVSQRFEQTTFTEFVDRVIAARATALRSRHMAELMSEANAKVAAAGEKARAAAAAAD